MANFRVIENSPTPSLLMPYQWLPFSDEPGFYDLNLFGKSQFTTPMYWFMQ